MSTLSLVHAKIQNGVWRGILTGASGRPDIEVRHLDKPVADMALRETEEGWLLEVPIPSEAISDGVQTFLILDPGTDTTISSFTLIAGEALSDDIRSEVDLLRAELDMLKRAFRRHCLETT